MKIARCGYGFLALAFMSLSSCDKVTDLASRFSSSTSPDQTEKSGGPFSSMPMVDKLREQMAASRSVIPGTVQLERNLDETDYEAFISTPGKLLVVDYHADWCGPCKRLSPILSKLVADSGGKMLIGKVDVDSQAVLAEKANVHSIPDVRLFRDGRQVDRFVGLLGELQLRELLARHSHDLKGGSLAAAPPVVLSDKPEEPTFERMSKDWMPAGIQRR